jgi:hypothetical protein
MQQIQLPPLRDGEIYLGGRIDKNGEVEHSALITVSDKRLPRDEQREFGKSIGGVLMNRYEGLVIYNEHRGLVKPEVYWTDDDCEWDPSYAWYQYFDGGGQGINRKSSALRAVFVRRFKN